ncbi:MAG: adenylate kinase [Candidatus Aenigmarchaeota archaeon]|nr:adenylate kinase [Candidatus Aenigmarchaeota archaeon]
MKKKNKIIILTGIPGSGKTTVLDQTLELLLSHGIRYKSVNYGTEMFDIAKNEGLVKTRDELRNLEPEEQKKLQKMAGMKIASDAKKANIVVDTHCIIKTPTGYLVGLPEWVVKEINPDIVVLIEGVSKEIYRRRANDDTRTRDEDSEELIDEHQTANKSVALAIGMMTGSTTKVLTNRNNKLHEAVEELKDIMK